ncbi:MAG: hypothetical protein J4F37_05220 [Acidobacteria bacterium]|nr:hypothetical protein [Acidobacteriota bacterium]
MAKKKDQRKGVFCLEGPWFGVKDRTSMEPVLRLLETLKGYKVPYLRFDVGTRDEFDFYLEKWAGASFRETHPILHLAFHGESGEIAIGEGRHTSVTLDDLAERLEGRCKGRVIHFCSCGTAAAHGRELKKFLARTQALSVCGYKEDVDWLESAAFDMLVLGGLQYASFVQVSSVEKFDRELKSTAAGLYRRLGFRMLYRQG